MLQAVKVSEEETTQKEVPMQSVSLDIWDKKYRLKTKQGDHDADQRKRTLEVRLITNRRRWHPVQVASNKDDPVGGQAPVKQSRHQRFSGMMLSRTVLVALWAIVIQCTFGTPSVERKEQAPLGYDSATRPPTIPLVNPSHSAQLLGTSSQRLGLFWCARALGMQRTRGEECRGEGANKAAGAVEKMDTKSD